MMLLVAIIAIDFATLQALLQHNVSLAVGRLLIGTVPMASILMAGVIFGLRHPRSRRFFLGFEVFGVIALALWGALGFFSTVSVFDRYSFIMRDIWIRILGSYPAFVPLPIAYVVFLIWMALPQVAFALVGGLAFHKFGIAERAERT
jgi:hypothetical protein